MNARSTLKNPLLFAQLALVLVLPGCVSGGSASQGVSQPNTRPTVVRPTSNRPVRNPELQMEPGLEGIIGATQAQITRQFGTPRLNVHEGDARKLQFTGTPCILDIYFYPTKRSHEPLATYVEARRGDGLNVRKVACARALRKP